MQHILGAMKKRRPGCNKSEGQRATALVFHLQLRLEWPDCGSQSRSAAGLDSDRRWSWG